jgi:hypothetical protein
MHIWSAKEHVFIFEKERSYEAKDYKQGSATLAVEALAAGFPDIANHAITDGDTMNF